MPSAVPPARPFLSTSRPADRLVAAAVVLVMALVAVVGYRMMPKPDVPVPLVENCRLDQRACVSPLPGGGRIEVAIEPRPIPATRPLTITVIARGVHPEKVEVDFAGVGMNMGEFRPVLETAGDGRFTGRITLPVCITGSMLWQATVLLETDRRVISVPFRFESRHA